MEKIDSNVTETGKSFMFENNAIEIGGTNELRLKSTISGMLFKFQTF